MNNASIFKLIIKLAKYFEKIIKLKLILNKKINDFKINSKKKKFRR